MTNEGLALHVHHIANGVMGPFEWCHDYAERLAYIERRKLARERPLRKALFAIVPLEMLPDSPTKPALVLAHAARSKANAAWSKANAARAKAYAAWSKAHAARSKADAAYIASIDVEALHKRLCHPNCPWDGRTIFAKGKSISVLEATA